MDDLQPCVERVLDAFGPARVMWGSDWPVCRLRREQARWHDAARLPTAGHIETDGAKVFGGAAASHYGIDA